METTKVSLDSKVKLQTQNGETLSLHVLDILWTPEEKRCMMYGRITPQQWQKVWAERLFNLSPEVVLQDFTSFEEDGLITLELKLDATILGSILSDNSDPLESFMYSLGGTAAESELILNSSNWRAFSVLQDVVVPDDPDAILQMGFQTIWADDE